MSDQLIINIGCGGIDITSIIFTGKRSDIYNHPVKYAISHYDGNDAYFSSKRSGVINRYNVFDECSWFNLSAASPAVYPDITGIDLKAATTSRKKSITFSFYLYDPGKFWRYGKKQSDVIRWQV